MIIKATQVEDKHILGETSEGIGYKFLTLSEDSYAVGDKCKIFIHHEIKLTKNNSITMDKFAFLNQCAKELFTFLIQLKGVGPKGAINIIENFGGSKNLFHALENNETLKIINLAGKYASSLISSIPNFKKRGFSFHLKIKNQEKEIKSELFKILKDMQYAPDKCISAIDVIDKKFTKEGKNIRDLPIENTLKEILSYLSNKNE